MLEGVSHERARCCKGVPITEVHRNPKWRFSIFGGYPLAMTASRSMKPFGSAVFSFDVGGGAVKKLCDVRNSRSAIAIAWTASDVA